ncbi:MAG: ATP-binding protein [Methanomassiliicoccaceae archaeon]|nr:ATP-binding protein [Methanomassiliicoccaceae archaeon]
MKIMNVSVKGLFGQHDHTVSVFSEGITYVHSPNGCGKSTLIRMISLLFTGKTDELESIPFERMDVSFDNETNVIVERSESGLSFKMQKNKIHTDLRTDELGSMVKITFIPSERTFIRAPNKHIVSAVESYAHDLYLKLKEAKKHCSSACDPNKTGCGGKSDDELVSWAKDLNAKLSFMRDAGFEIAVPSGIRFPPTRYDLIESKEKYTDFVYGISEFIERNYYLSESVIVFRDIINRFLSDKEMRIDGKGHVVFMMKNGLTLPLNSLSSGEKQIFIIFYRLLFETMPFSFVMMDEPEISLHVSWQQKMGAALKDISRLRGLQMLIATHSPQIIHDDWDLTNELRAGSA